MNTTQSIIKNKDWNCEKCGYLNFKRNKVCKKCTLRGNDWVCQKCTTLNFNGKQVCFKCGCTKDGKQPIECDWICHTCLTINERDLTLDKTEVKCKDCSQLYTQQNIPRLTVKVAYENEYENSKKVYQKLGVFVDWDCLKNIKMGTSLATDLLTRNYISLYSITEGIKDVVRGRDPDTGHYSECCCEYCCGIK